MDVHTRRYRQVEEWQVVDLVGTLSKSVRVLLAVSLLPASTAIDTI